MATGQAIIGTRLLDVFNSNTSPLTNISEVATFGNTLSNATIRIYDQNTPLATGYVYGVSNSSFTIVRSSAPSSTRVAIGTVLPSTTAQLHVQGSIATSNITTYNANRTISFDNTILSGISNIVSSNIVVNGVTVGSGQWNGSSGIITTSSNVGIGTTAPRSRLDVQDGITLFGSNVGIGTGLAPSALTVQGDGVVSGLLTVGQLIDQSAQSGSYNFWQLWNTANNTKIVQTNDTVAANRILFSLTLLPGQYILNANIPFSNLSSVTPIDTVNWAAVGLYESTTGGFSAASKPIFSIPLTAIGGGANDFDTVPFTTFVAPMQANGTSYVIAVTGRGHTLQFGGGPSMPMPIVYTVPTRTLGTNDSIAVRQAMQLTPFRKNFTSTQGQQTFIVTGDGTFTNVEGSNIDVYINGTKYIWKPPGSNTDYTVTANSIGNVSYYNVTLSQPLLAGNEVDIAVWPTVTGTTYFSSGYMYQSVQNYSGKWLNVVDGGMRTAERLVIDGDLFVGGSIHFGCNTTTFQSGAQWDGNPADITSNIIGTQNIIDGSITTSKVADGAVTSSKVNFLLGNIGIGTSVPTQRLDVGGNARMNTLVLEGSTLIGETNVNDTASNVFIKFNGSNSGANGDFAYIRQVGAANNMSLALDFHDDAEGGEFVIRDVESSNQNPDIVRDRFRVLRDPIQRLIVNGSGRFATSSAARYTYTVSTCNVPQLPLSDGFVNGVNITTLNRRARVSPSTAIRCVSTWTERSHGTGNLTIDSICWSPNLSLFVGVTNGSNLSVTSSDGVTWSRSTISASSRPWRTVTWAAELGLFVAFTYGTAIYATSTNGTTWIERTLTQGDRNSINIVWAPDISRLVVAIYNSNRVLYSSTGISWTAATINTQLWEGLCYSPELGLFVITATNGEYATSTDGITWVARSIPSAPSGAYRSVAWSPEIGAFVIVVNNNAVVLRSTDGINWTQHSIVNGSWCHVSWIPDISMFVAIANNSTTIATSFNGETWTTQTLPTSRDWTSAAWSPELGIHVVAAKSINIFATSAFAYPTPLNTLQAPRSHLAVNTDGNVGIGHTNPAFRLDVNGTIRTNSAVNTSSDARIKDNLVPLHECLQKVMQTQGYTYTRKDYETLSTSKDKLHIGYIAQEIRDVLPCIVHHDVQADMYSLAYEQVIPVLSEAIKELATRNSQLEQRVAELESKLSS